MVDTDTRTEDGHTRTDSTFRKEGGVRVSELVEREAQAIVDITRMWFQVGTASGRRTLGPSWMAITYCPSCNQITLTTSKRTKAGRWRCRYEGPDGPCESLIKPIMASGAKAYDDHAAYTEGLKQ